MLPALSFLNTFCIIFSERIFVQPRPPKWSPREFPKHQNRVKMTSSARLRKQGWKKLRKSAFSGKLDMQSAHACAVQTHFFVKASQKLLKIIKNRVPEAFLRAPAKKSPKMMQFGKAGYAIRTRLCSPNTLFRFRASARKVIQKASQNGASGHPKSQKIKKNGH